MTHKVLIIDTSVLCVWLQVPGKDHICKEGKPIVTLESVKQKIDSEVKAGARIVLPLATIIETGNHVTHIKGDNRRHVESFANFIYASIEGKHPWDIFLVQTELFSNENLRHMVDEWRKFAQQRLSMGDTSIKHVAEYYFSKGMDVEIFTGDSGLKAFEPVRSVSMLTRNRNRR